jgi:hypothetical protein
VIGRLPGERTCLSLVWAVLERASRGWRGVVMTPAAVRLLQELRRQLHHPSRLEEGWSSGPSPLPRSVRVGAPKRQASKEATGMGCKGVVIAESLQDPTVLNQFSVYRAFITGDGLQIDDQGTRGRWHLYWVIVSDDQIDAVQRGLRAGWYAHFWQADRLLVVFPEARFEMSRTDQATWQAAIAYGLAHGIPADELDFPTDDSIGTL